MRGTTKPTTENIHDGEMMMYDLNVTPRTSFDSQYTTTTTKDLTSLEKSTYPAAPNSPEDYELTSKHTTEESKSSTQQTQSSEAEKPQISPSLRLLFSLFPRRHLFLLLVPAVLSSLVTGGIAPFMTIVVGQIFGFFSDFSTSTPSADTRSQLLRNVGIGCLELVGLAVGSLALGSLTSALWIWVGEVNTREVRKVVYEAVGKKDMGWFDLKMSGDSGEGETEQGEGNGAIGAGGLMAKFSRETEDIRAASSLSLGQTLTHLTTSLTSLILAFLRSYQLTLVILSAVPLLMIVQGFSQGFASPLLAEEREETARAATSVERSLANISTVKAFNAQPVSLSHSTRSFKLLRVVASRLNRIWGLTSGLSQFITMGMFVQGFWFGSKLVRDGKVGVGDVMSVFWACLIASGNLQMCIPLWIVVVRGMGSMAGVLLDVIVPGDSYSTSHHAHTHNLRKITPSKCTGELALHSVSFSYPSRPSLQVLKDVSLFLPANEVTFIVGGSGSGKSTVGGVLGGIYKPKDGGNGIVLLDEQDTRYLDERWMHKHVACVGQQGAAGVVILEGRSVFENILLGLEEEDEFSLAWAPVLSSTSSSSLACSWTMETAPPALRTRVETAARAALLHEFVRDLPMGYDTILGDSSGEEGGVGVGLSGGQKQRLALARGVLRDPTVLILDEPTSALDPTTRLLVFSAIKHIRHGPPSLHPPPTPSSLPPPLPISRRNRTTVVITHDLSQIEKNDFVYVMKDGRVVEGGYRGDLEQVYVSTKETLERGDTTSSSAHDEGDGRGEFRKMLESQMRTGGFLPAVDDNRDASDSKEEVELEEEEDEEDEEYEEIEVESESSQHDSLPRELTSIRPLTWGDWMFEVVADLTRATSVTSSPPSSSLPSPILGNDRANPFLSSSAKERGQHVPGYKKKRPSSIAVPRSPTIQEENEFAFDYQTSLPMVPPAHFEDGRPTRQATMRTVQTRRSLQFTPSSMATSFTAVNPQSHNGSRTTGYGAGWSTLPKEYMEERGCNDVDDERESEEEEREFNVQKKAVQSSGNAVSARRTGRMPRMTVRSRQRRRREAGEVVDVKIHNPEDDNTQHDEHARPAFWKLMRVILPTVPNKPLLFFGIAICILSGAMTPIFSFILSRLLFEVSIGATNTDAINFFGGLVLGIAALDGLLLGLKYFVMESVGMAWVTSIRTQAFSRVLKQDRAWFDEGLHAPERLAQILVRDGDDARDLVSVVWGQFCVVLAMLGVGLLWALIQGWQLTLAGFAIAPVFAGAMALQSTLVANCEVRNKRAREEVARGYYEAIIHARSIRSMGFEGVFRKRFEDSVGRALTTGVKGAMVEGCTYGVASGLIYLAEALLFYVGAVLVAKGTYTYLQMVQVLNLVVFTVTIGSQLMAFTQRIAKCVQAASDFNILLNLLTNNTLESRGSLKQSLPSLFTSPIHFENISFSYPSRPSQPVLKNVDLTLYPGECVALVGASGSGKSTIAALLQRLYEPVGGKILFGEAVKSDEVDVRWLRQHIGVVSQHPNLFDASVKDNIRYGALATAPCPHEENMLVIPDDLVISASQAALLHDFVESLPQGYDTHLGENASLVSGGQAQRLMIARALARIWAAAGDREGRLLVLDECTSALDGESQEKVLDTIRGLRSGSSPSRSMPTTTTLMITHKLEVMQMCDRIIVLHEGRVVEQGSYDELMAVTVRDDDDDSSSGVFRKLARAGEWEG